MVGLDAAGRTTILNKLKKGETVKSIPEIGFGSKTLKCEGFNFIAWHVGFANDNRVLWKQYYQNTDGLIFVVDSHDRDRIEDAGEELKKMLAEEDLKECIVLVMANKQDINGALSPGEVTEKLGMGALKGRTWLVQGTSATSGQGIKEGFDWMASVLLKKETNKL